MSDNKLNYYREQIDSIDKKLIELLSKRLFAARQIKKIKDRDNLPALDLKRWQKVIIDRKKTGRKLGLKGYFIQEIFNSIHSQSLNVQGHRNRNIYGIQGGKGSFNEQALTYYLKKNNIKKYTIKYLYTTEKVLKNLNSRKIDFGLFAISNFTGGIVDESLQAITMYPSRIVDDFEVLIAHFLMKRKDVHEYDIKTIMAHPQVLAQCRQTLRRKFGKHNLESGKGDLLDTAMAARHLANGLLPKTTAILGPKTLSEIYGFDIIAENLQDKKDNLTRFLLVKR